MKNLVKRISFSTIILGSLFTFSTSMMAQNMPMRGPVPFSVYDSNSDGFVTEQEFNDLRAKRMQQKAEMGMPMRNAANAPDFATFDTNGDGKLTELELVKGQNEMMQNRRQNNANGPKGYNKGMMQQQ